MPYPKALTNYLNKVQNVSRNVLKVIPYKTDGVKSNSIIVVDLPNNAMLSLDTLTFHFKGTTTSTAGFYTFPRHIESLISKISVEINGLSLPSCNNLSDVYNIMYNLTQSSDMQTKRALYQNGGVQGAPTSNVTSKDYAIQHWLGFLGTAEGRVIDLGILGNVRLHITLENTNVLIASDGATGPEFQLDNLYFTVDSISIDDGTYYNTKAAFLNQGGVIEIPFTTLYSSLFNANSFTQSSRFSVSAQSLDWVLGTFVPNRSISGLNSNMGQSKYFKYIADAGSSSTTQTLVDWEFQINNVSIPNYKASKADAFPLILNVLGTSQSEDGGICSSISTQDIWYGDAFVAGVRLDLETSPDERYQSGLNTLGTQSTLSFNTNGGTVAYCPSNCFIVAGATSVLRASAGKTIEVVV